MALLAAPRPGESRDELRHRFRLGQIYSAAPDIDKRQFVDQLGVCADLAERVSPAVNLNDAALAWAERFNRSGSRAGQPNPTELSAEQTEFLVDSTLRLNFDVIKVDPNDIPNLPLRSPAFWDDAPWVGSSILAMFLPSAKPRQRGLGSRVRVDGKKIWTFPPDCCARVIKLMRDADLAVSDATP